MYLKVANFWFKLKSWKVSFNLWPPLGVFLQWLNISCSSTLSLSGDYLLLFPPKICWLAINKSFPCGSAGKESACNAGDLGSIPGLGRDLGEEKGYPIQYSGLEKSMNYIVHGVAKSGTWLSDFHFNFHKDLKEISFPNPWLHPSSRPGDMSYNNSSVIHFNKHSLDIHYTQGTVLSTKGAKVNMT